MTRFDHKQLVKCRTESHRRERDFAALELWRMCQRMHNRKPNEIRVDRVIGETASYFHLQASDILGASRLRRITRARQTAMHLARRLTDLSFGEIGMCFDRDHTTIVHADQVVVQRAE